MTTISIQSAKRSCEVNLTDSPSQPVYQFISDCSERLANSTDSNGCNDYCDFDSQEIDEETSCYKLKRNISDFMGGPNKKRPSYCSDVGDSPVFCQTTFVNERESSEKLTRGKQKIPIEFISDRTKRCSTFSKRKTGLMKKAVELAELTGAEVLLLIASETNHVYTFATQRLKGIIELDCGKKLIQTCLSSSYSDSLNSCDSPNKQDILDTVNRDLQSATRKNPRKVGNPVVNLNSVLPQVTENETLSKYVSQPVKIAPAVFPEQRINSCSKASNADKLIVSKDGKHFVKSQALHFSSASNVQSDELTTIPSDNPTITFNNFSEKVHTPNVPTTDYSPQSVSLSISTPSQNDSTVSSLSSNLLLTQMTTNQFLILPPLTPIPFLTNTNNSACATTPTLSDNFLAAPSNNQLSLNLLDFLNTNNSLHVSILESANNALINSLSSAANSTSEINENTNSDVTANSHELGKTDFLESPSKFLH